MKARSPVTFSVVAQGSGTLSYQWLHNGQPVAAATGTGLALATRNIQPGAGIKLK